MAIGVPRESIGAVAPASSLREVSPTDTGTLVGTDARACLWLYVSDTGDVAVVAEADTGEQILTIAQPGRVDVRAKRVRATGTTVTKVIAAFA
jgi:hypothetical protein